MQKAFYQKTFNIIRYLSIYAILSIVLSFTFHILIFLLNNEIFSKRVTIIQSKLQEQYGTFDINIQDGTINYEDDVKVNS